MFYDFEGFEGFEGGEVLKALFLSFGRFSFCSHAVGSSHDASNHSNTGSWDFTSTHISFMTLWCVRNNNSRPARVAATIVLTSGCHKSQAIKRLVAAGRPSA